MLRLAVALLQVPELLLQQQLHTLCGVVLRRSLSPCSRYH